MLESSPPITTVASGRWTSAPAPWEKAMGTNPRLATSPVIRIGRNRAMEARKTASRPATPSSINCRIAATRTRPSRTATPDSAMNPTPAEMLKLSPRTHKASTPPIAPSGTDRKINVPSFTDWKVEKRSRKIKARARGTTMDSRLVADWRFSKVPPHSREYPRGSAHLGGHPPLGLGDEARQIAAPDIRLHHDPPLAVFPPDLVGVVLQAELGQVFQRDHPALGVGDLERADGLEVIPVSTTEANLECEAPLPFHHLADDLATQSGDGVEHIRGADLIAGDALAVDLDAQEGQSTHDLCLHSGRPRDRAENLRDRAGQLLQNLEVVAIDPDAKIGADAREQLVEPQLDRLAEAMEGPRDDSLAQAVDLVDQLILRASPGPGVRLREKDPGIGQVHPRRLEPDFGPADPADHGADLVGEVLTKCLFQASGVGDRLVQRGAGGTGLGDHQIALVELGNELAAELQRDGNAEREGSQGPERHDHGVGQHPSQGRLVDPLCPADRQGVALGDPGLEEERRQDRRGRQREQEGARQAQR